MDTRANLILTGMKHTGKSTVGPLLAQALGRPFLDTDTVIAEISGKSPRELYDEGGPSLMMEWESKACREVSERFAPRESAGAATGGPVDSVAGGPAGDITGDSHPESCVLATGGGLADNPEACAILGKSGIMVFLDTDFEIVYQRVLASAERDGRMPSFLEGGDPRTLFSELFARRREKYVTMSQIHILTGEMLPREIVQKIMGMLKE